uniref:Doublecortin domain-containing protein n=1 Tax=Petromyzon marinus TaxID=7757 RepID=S4RWW7_PETMA
MNGTPSSEQSHALTHPPDGTLAHYLGVRHAGASALAEPITAKRVYFYKSGDPQFGGLKVAINNRTFKTFDALLDNLSRRMPLPFGVRTVSTPRGLHAVRDLEQLEDGKAYVCSDRRRAKPLDLEQASRRPQPWRSSSSRRQALRLLRRQEMGGGAEEPRLARATPRRLTLVRNGDATGPRYALLLSRRSASSGLAGLLADASQIMGFSVARLYTTDGRKVESLQALLHVPSTLVAAGREPFQPLLYDAARLPLLQNPRGAARAEGKTSECAIPPTSTTAVSLDNLITYVRIYTNSGFVTKSNNLLALQSEREWGTKVVPMEEDDIEKRIHVNPDGSMTVEMRVRFRLHNEVVTWKTRVSR